MINHEVKEKFQKRNKEKMAAATSSNRFTTKSANLSVTLAAVETVLFRILLQAPLIFIGCCNELMLYYTIVFGSNRRFEKHNLVLRKDINPSGYA